MIREESRWKGVTKSQARDAHALHWGNSSKGGEDLEICGELDQGDLFELGEGIKGESEFSHKFRRMNGHERVQF